MKGKKSANELLDELIIKLKEKGCESEEAKEVAQVQVKAQLMYNRLVETLIKKRKLKFDRRAAWAKSIALDPATALRMEAGEANISIQTLFETYLVFDESPASLITATWLGASEKSNIKLNENEAGRAVGKFKDANDNLCIIQETRDKKLAIGVKKDSLGDEMPLESRIILDEKTILDLLPLLQEFARTKQMKG